VNEILVALWFLNDYMCSNIAQIICLSGVGYY